MRKVVLTDAMLVAGLGLIVAGMGINLRSSNLNLQSKKLEVIKAEPTKIIESTNVLVDISGEVIKPGVYRLSEGVRINDVLVAAGGLTARADREWVEANINRAERVRDGMKIHIPLRGKNNQFPITNFQTSSNNQITNSKIINLNTASLAELDSLPGIGPVMGQRIIDYRSKNGGFKNVEEVKLVEGIGEKLYEKIKDKIGI